jgi:APA family basic amino acid/polyamine antiporter
MARDRLFFKSIGDLHPRFGTPGKALVLQCVWTCVLTLSGTFDMLTDMLIFVSWIFYALAAFGIFIFRRKYPIMERPFRTPGYPWVPLFFTLFAAGFVIVTVVNDVVNYMNGSAPIINSLYGLYLVLLGLPLYFFFRKGMKEVD